MTAEAILAVAGSGKTQSIVDRVSEHSPNTKALAITFTTTGQRELSHRIAASRDYANEYETIGWYGFLLRHIVRPYLPAVFPKVRVRNLHFVESNAEIPKGRGGWKYYMDDHGNVYSNRLSLLANKILEASNGAPMERLEGIFDYVYIDEVQDLCGNDLDIVQRLMESSLPVVVVGDPRQSLFDTSPSDQKYKKYRGPKIAEWLKMLERSGVCMLTELSETMRYNSKIAAVADLVHDQSLNFSPTSSTQKEITGHDGVFLVDKKDLGLYLEEFRPTVIRATKHSGGYFSQESFNFGQAKGLTRDRVVIISTGPIVEWLTSGSPLKEQSQARFYVALTRSKYSSAIVVEDANEVHANLWVHLVDLIELYTPAS